LELAGELQRIMLRFIAKGAG